MLGTIHEIFENKELPTTVRLGIIALIPKGDKDKKLISNWRPLTLLENLYKILALTLAARLKPVLDNLLGHEQKAYVPGRFIAECTRNTYDIFDHAKNNNLPGMILLVDFEKAFDSVSFEFILTSLDIFGFGENFKSGRKEFQCSNSNKWQYIYTFSHPKRMQTRRSYLWVSVYYSDWNSGTPPEKKWI